MTISGGEPLLHPDLDQIIARMRKHGILSGVITNGYLLTAERIERLNRAGLEYLQISIDNAMPDEVSKKSLKVLDQKLKLLAEHAVFQVNINSVLGSGVKNPEDALAVAHRAQELGFTSTVGILHDDQGQLKPLGAREIEIFEEIMAHGQAVVLAPQRLPAQHRQRETERLAMPCRRRAICTSARTDWFTTARSSAGIPAFLLKNTRPRTAAANTSRGNNARRSARYPAYSRSAWWIIGATRKHSGRPPRRHPHPNRSCNSPAPGRGRKLGRNPPLQIREFDHVPLCSAAPIIDGNAYVTCNYPSDGDTPTRVSTGNRVRKGNHCYSGTLYLAIVDAPPA